MEHANYPASAFRITPEDIVNRIIAAQEQERKLIGHELHDNVNQILSTGNLYLNMLDPERKDFYEIKEKALEMILRAVEEIRLLSKGIIKLNLRKEGLLESVRDLLNDLRATHIFNIKFNHGSPCDIESLTDIKKITLFRILQEQTKNIVKYSKAANVDIGLYCKNGQMHMLIQDDGVGFDTQTVSRGLGLAGIEERVGLFSGSMQLKSTPGKGCSMMVTIPLDAGKSIISIAS